MYTCNMCSVSFIKKKNLHKCDHKFLVSNLVSLGFVISTINIGYSIKVGKAGKIKFKMLKNYFKP